MIVAIPREVRREVIRRAGGRCEYCRLPSDVEVPPPHVDHVRARKHRGGDDLANLALTCDRCNLHKGTDLTSIDPDTDALTPLFDPRRMAWHEHFVADGGEVRGLTPAGRATVELLQMNEQSRITPRALLADACEWP